MNFKWNPIKFRPMTKEEVDRYVEEFGEEPDEEYKVCFNCPMPEDGQKILISTSWGVAIDTCEIDPDYGQGLEDRGDWDGVIAWAPLPEPYKPKKFKLSQYPLCDARNEALCSCLTKRGFCTNEGPCLNKGKRVREEIEE